ncbi:MAG: class I tRNA ligase family protein, partial [Bacteroidetes bacterium]|nr:class I tRNA ligase family protein [Bacteroidota bacterium]
MIQGVSQMMYRERSQSNNVRFYSNADGFIGSSQLENITSQYLSADLYNHLMKGRNDESYVQIYVPINMVEDGKVNLQTLTEDAEWRSYAYKMDNGRVFFNGRHLQYDRTENNLTPLSTAPVFYSTPLVEKMSKSKFNVVNPDDIIEKYGADTLRLYEMFLGPLEQSKPWDTNGIEGTFRFLRKFWNLFHDEQGQLVALSGAEGPTKAELKILHATLKKVTEDIGHMSFNTSVAQFMIAVNELGALKCRKRAILEPLTIALAPFAPHIAEELWAKLGHAESISTAPWPQWDAQYLQEDSFSYPISFNGKTRMQLEFPVA